jgi:hypothetical protein
MTVTSCSVTAYRAILKRFVEFRVEVDHDVFDGALASGVSGEVPADGAGAFDRLGDVAGLLVDDGEVLFVFEIFRKAEDQLQRIVDIVCDAGCE